MDLTDAEREFVDEARRRIQSHSERRKAADRYDKIHAVARSTSGEIYEGTPFETSQPQFDCCAERHAINELHYAETEATAFDAILVAGPVPDEGDSVTTPCGACRHAIEEFGDDPTVFCTNFVREDDGWTMFPTIERYTADELYPHHQPHPTWD